MMETFMMNVIHSFYRTYVQRDNNSVRLSLCPSVWRTLQYLFKQRNRSLNNQRYTAAKGL